jgi:hypothetical protein
MILDFSSIAGLGVGNFIAPLMMVHMLFSAKSYFMHCFNPYEVHFISYVLCTHIIVLLLLIGYTVFVKFKYTCT